MKRWIFVLLAGALCAEGVYRGLHPLGLAIFVAESLALAYVAAVFADSLSTVPLITRIAVRAKGSDLIADEERYTRALTEIWVGVLAALAFVNMLMTMAPTGTYDLAERISLDFVPFVFFLVEHLYRRLFFSRIWMTPPLGKVIRVVVKERYHWR